jgi:hypothetical protein
MGQRRMTAPRKLAFQKGVVQGESNNQHQN